MLLHASRVPGVARCQRGPGCRTVQRSTGATPTAFVPCENSVSRTSSYRAGCLGIVEGHPAQLPPALLGERPGRATAWRRTPTSLPAPLRRGAVDPSGGGTSRSAQVVGNPVAAAGGIPPSAPNWKTCRSLSRVDPRTSRHAARTPPQRRHDRREQRHHRGADGRGHVRHPGARDDNGRGAREHPGQLREFRASTRPGVSTPRAIPDWLVTTPTAAPAARSRSSAARSPGTGRTRSGSPL